MMVREVDMVSIVARTIGEEDITMVIEAVVVTCKGCTEDIHDSKHDVASGIEKGSSFNSSLS